VKGKGVEKDDKEAVRLYRLAAEQKHAAAQCNLACYYLIGKGVEKDERKAAHLFKLAADQGHADAQCNLGFCYENGWGVEKDVSEAVRFFGLAADQRFAKASQALLRLSRNPNGALPVSATEKTKRKDSVTREQLEIAQLKAELDKARLKTELENARLKTENAALKRKLERLEASRSKPLLDEDGREIGRVPICAPPTSSGRKRPRSPNENVRRQPHAPGAAPKKAKPEKAATPHTL
jgi:hypothetical protein